MYGHPHEQVLRSLAEEDVMVFRTDEQGAVQYHSEEEEAHFPPICHRL